MKRNAAAAEVDHIDDCKQSGQFTFTDLYGVKEGGPYGMVFCCPCGCGEWGSLAFDNRPADYLAKYPDMARPVWHWNGNREKPTLSPSIQKTSGCKWHGHLRAGVFEEC